MANSTVLLLGALVGVYYGVNMLEPPNPIKVFALCREYNFTRIRLPEPDTKILDAFQHSLNDSFTLDISNKLLTHKMLDASSVQNWFDTFVKPYKKLVTFQYIAVGEDAHPNILPTMIVLRRLLGANNLTKVQLTTTVNYHGSNLMDKGPPSKGAFDPRLIRNLKKILLYLHKEGKPELMVKLYPFRKIFYDNSDRMSIDYATFGGKDSVQDGPFTYHNLFDAMVDTIYAAIEKLGDERLNDVKVVIGETGWPTNGRRKYTNVDLARKYNKNVIEHMNSGKGTPRRPNVAIKGFIRGLFNENSRPQGESRYYGLYNTNMTPVYPLFSIKIFKKQG